MNDPMIWFATGAVVLTIFALLRLRSENSELRDDIHELKARLLAEERARSEHAGGARARERRKGSDEEK